MPTPSTGTLSFTNIKDEFGLPSGKNLGAYRVSQTFGHLSNLPLDNGVPQSGEIAFSNLRGKKLNVVVDNYTPGYNNTTRRNSSSDYDNNAVCVGGFRTKPAKTDMSGRRVYIAVNQTIGSDKGGRTNVALKIPNAWSSDAIIRLDVGPSGRLQGAGGNGGNGGGGGGNGQGGQNGSSALGIGRNVNVVNNGVIRCGYGGGGGGGGGYSDPNKDPTDYGSGGGGGGGGAGLPAGDKGSGGGSRQNGQNGNNGNLTNGGGGGSGGDGGDARGGKGGDGGGDNGGPGNGQGGSSDRNNGSGGGNGNNGIGIIVVSGVTLNQSGNAPVGGTQYNGSYG